MSKETEKAVGLFLQDRIGSLERLHISWFGGEPLIASEIVLRVSELAKIRAEKIGCKFTADVTTNGSKLNPTMIDQLVSVNVSSFQITLDGIGDAHDATRKRANGSGTFDAVFSALNAIKASQHDVDVSLRLHYSADTVSKLPETIKFLKNHLLEDERFHVNFHRIERLGGQNDSEIAFADPSTEFAILSECQSLLGVADYPQGVEEDHICYAAMANSLIVRADGKLAKCTVALSDARNHVGQLNSDGSLEIFAERVRPWIEGLLRGEADSAACPLAFLPTAVAAASA